MHYEFATGAAALWRLDTNLQSRLMRSGVTISNGLAWSADRRWLYFIDSPTLQVLRFALDEQGDPLDEGTVCVEIPAAWNCVPDGMNIDAEGMLWIALHDGSAVTRWDPGSGEQLATVEVPCSKVTSCCFGGANFDQLFITTARHQLAPNQLEQQPLAGGLFVAEVGVAGLPAHAFAG
jgi:sugar lactone lactonase YvrE